MRGDVALPGESQADEDKDEKEAEEHPLTERIQAVIGEKVEGVRPSKRLTDSPACLVLSDFGVGIQMRKILEASGQTMPESKPFFEFNSEHPLLHRLDTEVDEDRFAELVELLFDQASLAEGGTLQDPATYVSRMNRLLMDLLPPSES
jgi:molecular chaperone HtpG